MTTHTCTGDCWAYLIRYGFDENSDECNPFDAERAAEKDRLASA